MSTIKQVDAVHSAITSVLSEAGIHFEDGQNVSEVMTSEHRQQVNSILFEGFKSGAIQFSGTLPEDAKLKSYVSGLQSNWIRKDKRLNGGVKYQAKNPGSRAGSSSPEIVAMRTLLKTLTPDTEDYTEVKTALDQAISALKPTKSIDLSALPSNLVKFIK